MFSAYMQEVNLKVS